MDLDFFMAVNMALIAGLKAWILWFLLFIRRTFMIGGFFALMSCPISYDWAALLIRLAVGCALLPYGIKKYRQRANADHFPKVLFFSRKAGFYTAMTVEMLVPICLILGFCTRLVAIPGMINMGVAFTVSKDSYWTSPAAVYCLMMIAIFFIGGGLYSLDGLLMSALAK